MTVGLGLGIGLALGSSPPAAAAAVAGDSYFELVKLLLGFNGTDGSAVFTDESPNPVSFVVGDGAPVLTTAQKKFGVSSLDLNGSSSLSTPGAANPNPKWNPGANDFTLEMFVRHSAVSSVNYTYTAWGNTSGFYAWYLAHLVGGGGTWNWGCREQVGGNVGLQGPGSQPVTTGPWQHICMERSGGVLRAYVDGVMNAKRTDLGTDALYNDATMALRIGALAGLTEHHVGQIDEYRLSVGIARYNSDAGFTPPVAEFPRTQGTLPPQPVIVQEARAITNAASSVTFASAPTNGNRLIAFCTHYNNPNTLNSAGGWKQLLNTNGAVDDGWAIAYKDCGAGESATQSPFTFGASGNSISMFEIQGAAAPLFGNLTTDQENTTASLTKASAAAPMSNCLLIGAFFAISTGGLTPTLAAVTQTSQTSGNGTATQGVPRCITNFKAIPAKGASVNAQATYSGAVKQWVATLLLLPA